MNESDNKDEKIKLSFKKIWVVCVLFVQKKVDKLKPSKDEKKEVSCERQG
jgi:hypothetical protein